MWTWAPWGSAHQATMYFVHLCKVYIVGAASSQHTGRRTAVSLHLVSPAALRRGGDEQWGLQPVVSAVNTLHSSALAFPPDRLAADLSGCRPDISIILLLLFLFTLTLTSKHIFLWWSIAMNSGVSQPLEISCSVVWWYSRSASFARWQQGGKTVAGWMLSFTILWALCRCLTSPMSLMLCRWCQWCSGWFSSPAVYVSCTGLGTNVLSQDAFCCFS